MQFLEKMIAMIQFAPQYTKNFAPVPDDRMIRNRKIYHPPGIEIWQIIMKKDVFPLKKKRDPTSCGESSETHLGICIQFGNLYGALFVRRRHRPDALNDIIFFVYYYLRFP